MQLAHLLRETLDEDSQDVWENERTPTPVRRFGVRLHTAGLSIRETVAILDLLGVDRSHRRFSYSMSSNSETQSEGGDQGNQPELTDFERTCPVCGRVYEKNGAPPISCGQVRTSARCSGLVTHCTGTTDTPPGQSLIVGSDRLSFEATYLAIRSLIHSESDRLDAYVSDTPYQIQEQK